MAENIRLREFDSRDVLPLSLRDEGVYLQPLSIVGNSFVSKLFIQYIDPGATVKIDYYDYGVGGEKGEEYPLPSHVLKSQASLIPDRVLVTNFNDKPVLRCTVTGGEALFGVYITVVTASSTDIDNALQLENDPVNLQIDKGIPITVFDDQSQTWRFARGAGGIQDVRVTGNVAVGEPGMAFFVDFQGDATPGLEQTLVSTTVPVGYKLNLLSVQIVSSFQSDFYIFGDGDVIGSGRTGPAVPQVNFAYRIARTFESGKIIEIKATVRAGAPIDAIECYLQGTLSLA